MYPSDFFFNITVSFHFIDKSSILKHNFQQRTLLKKKKKNLKVEIRIVLTARQWFVLKERPEYVNHSSRVSQIYSNHRKD